ncbi:sigma-54-dependent transcriptional regulator [Flexithrix dorotheae]|uniref:sigma-54-dependent transcriptional regulator n=1 Tax=Flexithrix dorotheae TaxID=70993 RepID=UPI00037AF81A|nr:sigma-54 dependent transcriptional regulator [Flexithrix dorotheae]
MSKILIIDDDFDICKLLTRFFSKHGYETFEAHNAKSAIDFLKETAVDLVLTDFRLPDEDGISLLQKIKLLRPQTLVIMITGYSDIRISVKAIKAGAFDYVTKPLHPDEILSTVKSALKKKNTVNTPAPAKQIPQRFIHGTSPESQNVLKHIKLVAPTQMTVVIEGETGTGKEYVANTIHNFSSRAGKPFVAVDCGALSKELAGSELFGHVKGAFTGAIAEKTGCFQEANGGTIFLDEIGNLPYEIQVKLLRVLQERKISKVGSNKEVPIDVRIVTATNDDLRKSVADGSFREDLYHRLNEFNITLSPLRKRKEDIILFANHFLRKANEDLGKDISGFSSDVVKIFNRYPWYGNLREMRNVVKRAALITQGEYIQQDALPHEITYHHADSFSFDHEEEENITDLKSSAEKAEKAAIIKALQETDNNKTKAAKVLKIDRKTLYNKLRDYAIDL